MSPTNYVPLVGLSGVFTYLPPETHLGKVTGSRHSASRAPEVTRRTTFTEKRNEEPKAFRCIRRTERVYTLWAVRTENIKVNLAHHLFPFDFRSTIHMGTTWFFVV